LAVRLLVQRSTPSPGSVKSSTGTSTVQTNVRLADKLAGWTAMALGLAGKSK
jgi:hypothetical protein